MYLENRLHFTVHNHSATDQFTDEIKSKLHHVLEQLKGEDLFKEVDYVDASLWIDDFTAFATQPVQIIKDQRTYSWGSINQELLLESINIDSKIFNLTQHYDRTVHQVFGAFMFALANFAKNNDHNHIHDRLYAEYIDQHVLDFVTELNKGQSILIEEEANQDPVLVLEYAASDQHMGSDKDLEFRHDLEEILDDFLEEEGIGFVDGGQIGAGTMEIFCQVEDVDTAKTQITKFLKERGIDQPQKMYQES